MSCQYIWPDNLVKIISTVGKGNRWWRLLKLAGKIIEDMQSMDGELEFDFLRRYGGTMV